MSRFALELPTALGSDRSAADGTVAPERAGAQLDCVSGLDGATQSFVCWFDCWATGT